MAISRLRHACIIAACIAVLVFIAAVLPGTWNGGFLDTRREITGVPGGTGDPLESCAGTDVVRSSPGEVAPIHLEDVTERLGERVFTKTFSLAVSDIDNDGRDDILVGAHNSNPYLFINEGEVFSDHSKTLFPRENGADRHGYTLADLDNDGDLDVVIAGGGNDGVGKGTPNIFLRNTTEGAALSFRREPVDAGLSLKPGRARSLVPLASADGQALDLYYTTLLRDDYPNMLLVNSGDPERFDFRHDRDSFLSIALSDHGRGVIADLDGDGKNDYALIDGNKCVVHWHPGSGRPPSLLARGAYSLKAADFNNDGQLDLFIGRATPATRSDRVTLSADRLIYVVHRNEEGDTDAISFRSGSDTLEFDLAQHIPATDPGGVKDGSDIFIGQHMANPAGRTFSTSVSQASGAPAGFDQSGIYIWHSPVNGVWTVKWQFHDFLDRFKGTINGSHLAELHTTGFHEQEPRLISDALLINQGQGEFARMCSPVFEHNAETVGTTVADFNNDGFLDIVGVRHSEQGSPNREAFILANRAGQSFHLASIPLREQDRLHRADLIAHGFFNEDGLPDIIISNGFGQMPGTEGPLQLLLNRPTVGNDAILLRLEGDTANSFGIGAKLTLVGSGGEPVGYRVAGLNTNISQDSHWIQFGLGKFPGPYRLDVTWPDGSTSAHPLPGPGRYTVRQADRTPGVIVPGSPLN